MSEKEFYIGKRKIGGENPCFIIAEIGINHNNDFAVAKKLIDSAADAGCDAVKFQYFKIDSLYSKKAGKLDWQDNEKKYSYDIYKANKSFQIPAEWLPKIKDYCRKKNIILLSSIFDKESADEVEKLDFPAFKLSSTSLTNIPLLKYVARKKKPIILSIGGASFSEIEESVNAVLKFNKNIALLHCHLKYPTPLKYVNINVLKTLKKIFPFAVIGYSDHTEHPYKAPEAAITLGAKIIEKHITLWKKMKGPDHFFALEPQELKSMVQKIRATEKKISKGARVAIDSKLLGFGEIKVNDTEKYMRDFAYQTIITVKKIRKGERFTDKNIRILRPGKIKRGLEPKYYDALIKDYKAKSDIPSGRSITWKDTIWRLMEK